MNLSELSVKQKSIYDKLDKIFESQEQLHMWLSLPNKLFRNKAPIDVLLSSNYDYFDRFFENSNIE
jgi:uncharacterized protein (DUF2384 family)